MLWLNERWQTEPELDAFNSSTLFDPARQTHDQQVTVKAWMTMTLNKSEALQFIIRRQLHKLQKWGQAHSSVINIQEHYITRLIRTPSGTAIQLKVVTTELLTSKCHKMHVCRFWLIHWKSTRWQTAVMYKFLKYKVNHSISMKTKT